MTDEENKIIRRTYHEIALLASDRARMYDDDGMSREARSLEDFAGDLWLRLNDLIDVEVKK